MEKYIYLVREFGGQYEDSWEAIRFAFFNKETRDAKIKELNTKIDEMESYRELWNEISDKLNEIETPEYDKFWEEYDSDEQDVPEEYQNYLWCESVERFIYWMQKELNDIYVQYSEDIWKEIYKYYEEQHCQYGSLYTYNYDAIDVKIEDAE
jgi:hypothetical protein